MAKSSGNNRYIGAAAAAAACPGAVHGWRRPQPPRAGQEMLAKAQEELAATTSKGQPVAAPSASS